jgi:hypothetical protein
MSSLALGLKAARSALTLGNRLYTGYTLGKKLVGLGSKIIGSKSSQAKPSVAGMDMSNMIYNKSNMGDIQYIPMGMKKMNSMRKSYLEKKRR